MSEFIVDPRISYDEVGTPVCLCVLARDCVSAPVACPICIHIYMNPTGCGIA